MTAASIYHSLRTLNVSNDLAEATVLSLGTFNEKIETYIKIGKPDSNAEIRKDFYNNWAGIVAARWVLDGPKQVELKAAIAMLATSRTLMLRPDDAQVTDGKMGQDVASAQQWLAQRKQFFADRILDALNRSFPKTLESISQN